MDTSVTNSTNSTNFTTSTTSSDQLIPLTAFFQLNLHFALVISCALAAIAVCFSFMWKLWRSSRLLFLPCFLTVLITLISSLSGTIHFFLIDTHSGGGVLSCLLQRLAFHTGLILATTCGQLALILFTQKQSTIPTKPLKWIFILTTLILTAKLAAWAYVITTTTLVPHLSSLDASILATFGVCTTLTFPPLVYLPLAVDWTLAAFLFIVYSFASIRHWKTTLLDGQIHHSSSCRSKFVTSSATGITGASSCLRNRRLHHRDYVLNNNNNNNNAPWNSRPSRLFAWIPLPVQIVFQHDPGYIYILLACLTSLLILPISLVQVSDPNGFTTAPFVVSWLFLTRWSVQGIALQQQQQQREHKCDLDPSPLTTNPLDLSHKGMDPMDLHAKK